MQGRLDGLNIAQLLSVVNAAKKSGTLRIFGQDTAEEKLDQEAEIFFKDGKVLAARTHHTDRNLIDELRHAGKLSKQTAKLLTERFGTETDKRIAMQLVSGSYVTRDDITKSLQTNTLELIQEIVNWNRHHYTFSDELPDFSDRMIAPIDIEKVVKNATRMARKQKQLEQVIPDLTVGLNFPDSAPTNLSEMTLSRDEWRVIGFAKPNNTLEDIADACNLTPTAIRQIVARLTDLGVLEIVTPEAPDSDAAATEDDSGERRLSRVETQVMKLLNPNAFKKKD